jgi:2-alkenal reductase
MNELDSPGGGGPDSKPPSPAILLTLVLAVALLAGAISGTAVALLNDSDDDAPEPATIATTPALSEGFAEDAISNVATRAFPSVVAIVNEFSEGELLGSTAGGAGVVIDERGFILTNAHLVQIPGQIFVLLSTGEVRPAVLVSHDAPYTDLAVIFVEEGGLTPLPIGDSDQLQPGQTLIAIGSPDIDYYNSVTTGVVSALGRRKQITNVWFEDLIQTDAAINVGNSGGPLLNLNGEVVGLNTFRDLGGGEDPLFGISFAISSRTFVPIVQEILDTGSFARPYLGVDHVDITPGNAEELGVSQQQGALIQDVTAGSPAAEAGLQAGDIVTMFGEIPLSSQFGLLNAMGVTAPEALITLQLIRDGQTMELDVQLEPR